MAIQSIEQSLILPIAGKIRLGIKKESAGGVEYPSNTPFFNLADAPGVAEVYGPQPTELHIQFFSTDMETISPYYYRYFSGGRKGPDGKMVGGELKCKGDGVTAEFFAGRDATTRIVPTRVCPGPDKCPDGKDKNGNKQCKPSLNLYFILPLVDPYKIYRIDSTSWYNIRDLIPMIKFYTGIDNMQGDQAKRRFTRMVFTLTKYLESGMTYHDDKTNTDKKSNQYLITLKPAEGFFKEHGNQLLARDQRIEIELSPPMYGHGATIQGGNQALLQSPMDDNYAEQKQIAPMGQSSSILEKMTAISNEPDVVAIFDKICALTKRSNTEKARLITVRKFETKADPKAETIAYLEKEIAKIEAKPQAPTTAAPPVVEQPKADAPAVAPAAQVNADSII